MSAIQQDFSTFRFTPNSAFAPPRPATFQWPKAKETPQAPSPRAWLPFKSPPRLEQRELAVILLIRSAPDVGGSPVGHWATVQLVPLSECFVICGTGIFFRRQWGAAGYGSVALVLGARLMLGQGDATWPEEDSADVTLGKCPFHGVWIHHSSSLSHVPICWQGGLKATLQGWKFSPRMASHQVLHLKAGLTTQQHAQSIPTHSSHLSASPNPDRPGEE